LKAYSASPGCTQSGTIACQFGKDWRRKGSLDELAVDGLQAEHGGVAFGIDDDGVLQA
jgi:hypothetical protein